MNANQPDGWHDSGIPSERNQSSQNHDHPPIPRPVPPTDAILNDLKPEIARLASELDEHNHIGTATAQAEHRAVKLRVQILENALRSARTATRVALELLDRTLQSPSTGQQIAAKASSRLKSEITSITEALDDSGQIEGGVTTVLMLTSLIRAYQEQFGPIDHDAVLRAAVLHTLPRSETSSYPSPRDDTPTMIFRREQPKRPS